QTSLLAIDRKRLDLEAELARTMEHIEHLRLEMEREGLAPDRSGKIVAFDEAVAMDPMFAEGELEAPSVQGGAEVDVEAMRAQIEDLRRQIRRLGTINAEAPEDFREFKERHEFLTTQLADLTDSSDQLRTAIADLNEEIRTRFTATFDT